MDWDSNCHVAARGRRPQDRTINAERRSGGDVKHPGCRPFATLAAAAIAAALLLPATIGEAQAQRVLTVNGAKRSAAVGVTVGKTEDVRIDAPFTDITIGDSDVADVTPLTDRSLSILGKKIGTTRVSIYGEDKRLVGIFDIEVSYDISRLATELRRITSGGIKVSSANGRIMLSGSAHDAATLDRAVVIARQFAPDIINAVQVLAPQQVMLEVRFIEATRQAGRALGIQWNSFGQNTLANIGNQVPRRRSLPVPRGCDRLAAGLRRDFGVAVRLSVRHDEQGRLARRRRRQCARREGPDPQPRRAQPGRPVRRHRQLSRRRRISDPGPAGARHRRDRIQEVRRGARLHPDRAAGRRDQSQDRAGGQRARPEPSRADQRLQHPAADRTPRLHHARAARRPELRARRPPAEQEHQRAGAIALDRRCAGARRAVPQRKLSGRTRPISPSSSRRAWCDRPGRATWSRRRSTTRCRQTTSTFS